MRYQLRLFHGKLMSVTRLCDVLLQVFLVNAIASFHQFSYFYCIAFSLQYGAAFCKFNGVHGAHLARVCGDVPFIILHEVKDG